MKDKKGKEIKEGDVIFYSERPFSNYADAIEVVVVDECVLKVKTLFVNGHSGTEYIEMVHDQILLDLEFCDLDIHNVHTGVFNFGEVLTGVTPDMVDIDFCNKHFPLERKG